MVKKSKPPEPALGPFRLELMEPQLPAKPISWAVRWEPRVASTQDLARAAAGAGEPEGWTIVTDYQERGRGRLGRPWLAADQRDLLFSLLLYPDASLLSLLPLLAGLALAEGVRRASGLSVDLKWPNDLLIGERKLAGVLLERGPRDAVALGVGLNVNSTGAELPPQATSIAVALGHPVPREPLLAAALDAIGEAVGRVRREGSGFILPAWRKHSSMLGRRVSYEEQGQARVATAEDLEPDGALRVRLDDGTRHRLYAGDVRMVRA
ncbi:MAG: biotin--[acetyl-CoA-carboxylase] ligase [Candidatus Dormibacter sp.]